MGRCSCPPPPPLPSICPKSAPCSTPSSAAVPWCCHKPCVSPATAAVPTDAQPGVRSYRPQRTRYVCQSLLAMVCAADAASAAWDWLSSWRVPYLYPYFYLSSPSPHCYALPYVFRGSVCCSNLRVHTCVGRARGSRGGGGLWGHRVILWRHHGVCMGPGHWHRPAELPRGYGSARVTFSSLLP